MTYFGNIKSYDSAAGAGTISPENGGDALPFKRADLQQEAQEPKVDERYGYDTVEINGADKRAVNLQQQGEASAVQAQARAQQG